MVVLFFFSFCSIPAVLCSNNWQSAVNEPSTSNHVANEPVGLNHVTPLPAIVHQLPEFNQDSWTVNPADSSVNTQPPNQTNNNNNNNSLFTIGQATISCSAGDHHVCTSNLDSNPINQMSTFSRTNGADGLTTTTTTASSPSELSGTSNGSQTAGTAASETITTADMDLEDSTTNGTAEETQTTNGTANELPSINAEDVQESSMDSQAGVQ